MRPDFTIKARGLTGAPLLVRLWSMLSVVLIALIMQQCAFTTPVRCASARAAPEAKQSLEQTQFTEVKSIELQKTIATTSAWHVSVFQLNDEANAEKPDGIPCRISFWKSAEEKFKNSLPVLSALADGSMTYSYQTVLDLSLVKLKPEKPAVSLTARFSGGGSGSLTRTIIWTYDSDTDDFTQASAVSLTEISDYKLISKGPLAGMLITADKFWQMDEETHFDPHRFTIEVFQYSDRNHGYAKVLEYITDKKYESEKTNDTYVIDAELEKIKQLLKLVYVEQ